MLDEFQRVEDWELLAQFAQAYRSLSDTLMDQITLHRSQAMVLCKLFVQDGMTQSEIAQQLSIQGATVTDMLQRMEESGLVTRRRDLEDNRLVRVYLTDSGREKERFIMEQFLKLESAVFAGFDEKNGVYYANCLTGRSIIWIEKGNLFNIIVSVLIKSILTVQNPLKRRSSDEYSTLDCSRYIGLDVWNGRDIESL